MAFDITLAVTWLLFLALFPIAFFWLRRAWRIAARRDHTEVALRRGEPPPEPARWAPYELAINLAGGAVIVGVIVAVVLGAVDYATWSAIAGTTIWSKFFASFALGRHAHLDAARRGGKPR